jgi:hypothetical protein
MVAGWVLRKTGWIIGTPGRHREEATMTAKWGTSPDHDRWHIVRGDGDAPAETLCGQFQNVAGLIPVKHRVLRKVGVVDCAHCVAAYNLAKPKGAK